MQLLTFDLENVAKLNKMKKKKAQGGGGPKKAGPKQSNPFEIKVHKVKHQVLGKKSNKEAVGNPNKKKQKVRPHNIRVYVYH